MKKQTFEEYLQERFLTDFPESTQTKDNFINNYETWITEMQADDWIKYAQQWETVINF
jgi:hypothetical protein